MQKNNGIRCILPPHLLSEIAQHGTPEQRAAALKTLNKDFTLRALRMNRELVQQRVDKSRATRVEADKPFTRTIYDTQHSTTLPGSIVRSEGSEASSDVTVNEAYDGLGWTHSFYADIFERNSIDDEGMALNASVHYGVNYDNAFWDGERMVFGDGDNDLFNRFTIALDIIGHELSHGVIEDEAQLTYMGQSGALNESLADVFGSMVKQYALKQSADQADWLIGKGLFTANVEGIALRSMKAPGTAYNDDVLGKDPQPAHMSGYVHTVEDNGGVHLNSGIPNHAFYLVATKLGGYAWERAGHIWYETLRAPTLRANANFRAFARLSVLVAQNLYGVASDEQKSVREAWQEVGVKVTGSTTRKASYADSVAD